jgi:hypothetical protein
VESTRGFRFDQPINKNNKDNIFVACQFGHIDMLEFLHFELNMDIFRIKLDGESTLEYCLRRANFDCYIFVLNYIMQHDKFVDKSAQELENAENAENSQDGEIIENEQI